jgi:hypothetical protein
MIGGGEVTTGGGAADDDDSVIFNSIMWSHLSYKIRFEAPKRLREGDMEIVKIPTCKVNFVINLQIMNRKVYYKSYSSCR